MLRENPSLCSGGCTSWCLSNTLQSHLPPLTWSRSLQIIISPRDECNHSSSDGGKNTNNPTDTIAPVVSDLRNKRLVLRVTSDLKPEEDERSPKRGWHPPRPLEVHRTLQEQFRAWRRSSDHHPGSCAPAVSAWKYNNYFPVFKLKCVWLED